jgi:hypothetical protein
MSTVATSSRSPEQSPREHKRKRGHGRFVRAKPPAGATDPGLDESLEVDASSAGVGGNTDRKTTPTA